VLSNRVGGSQLLDPGAPTGFDPLLSRQPAGLPCQVNDADLWFADLPAELELAKGHCQACPARPGCLDGALRRREPWGVWGGELFERGRVVGRKRLRGRPRKTEPVIG